MKKLFFLLVACLSSISMCNVAMCGPDILFDLGHPVVQAKIDKHLDERDSRNKWGVLSWASVVVLTAFYNNVLFSEKNCELACDKVSNIINGESDSFDGSAVPVTDPRDSAPYLYSAADLGVTQAAVFPARGFDLKADLGSFFTSNKSDGVGGVARLGLSFVSAYGTVSLVRKVTLKLLAAARAAKAYKCS